MVYLIKTTGQRDFTDFIFIIIKVNVFASLKKKEVIGKLSCAVEQKLSHANLDSILLYTTVNSRVLIQRDEGEGIFQLVCSFVSSSCWGS